MLTFFKSAIRTIYCLPPPRLTLIALLILFLWAIMSRIRPKGWRAVNLILIPLSVICVLFATLICREAGGQRGTYLIPFEKWKWALIQPEYYREMFMNGLLFVSFGMTASCLLPEKRGIAARILLAVFLALTVSTAVEYLQYRMNVGYFETDDILCNALGAFFGAAHLILARYLPNIIDRLYGVGARTGKDER